MPGSTRVQTTSNYSGLERCRAEMTRAHRIVMRTFKGSDHDRRSLALKRACEAYRAAMPLLTSPENVQDFIACFTHGMLEGVFYQWESPVFLSAARAAMSSFQSHPQQEEPSAEPVHPPKKSDVKPPQAA